MRNLIPRTDDDDLLPSDLRAQFESLQHLISQQKQENTETDEETLGSNGDETLIHMAVSTAVNAEKEINGLLNGIAELEHMLDEDSFVSSSKQNSSDSDDSIQEIDNKNSSKHASVKNGFEEKDEQKAALGRKECLMSSRNER